MNRIDVAFGELKRRGETGLFPYLTVGYPDMDGCRRLAEAAIAAGADGLELGLPFSDPVADGVTLQRASFHALQKGASPRAALELAADLRRQHDLPLVFMTYYNLVHSYGVERFAGDAACSGVDGVIVPDLPPEEAGELREACEASGLYLIHMLAPTSSPERVRWIGARARGFIYCVSVVGVTGARSHLAEGLPDFLGRVRAATSVPLLVGFGISRPDHIREVGRYADAVVVASALTDLVDATPADRRIEAARLYLAELKAACRRQAHS